MKLEVMYSARLDNVDDAVGPSSLSVSSAGNGITSALRLEHAANFPYGCRYSACICEQALWIKFR
jgi:hypothetical protein